MTVEPGWVPPGIDTGKANIARVYDYWLGGSSNFRADQDAARAMIAIEPNIRGIARANRAFLGRAVRFLATEAGIRQFVDIGSGIPTGRNVHEVAQEAAPGSRVVYADVDEVAVAHSRLVLEDNADTEVIQADLREPDAVLTAPETQLLIDFRQPVGLLLVSVLYFLDDHDDPWRVVAHLRDALAPGSYLVLSHGTGDAKPDVAAATSPACMVTVITPTRRSARPPDAIRCVLCLYCRTEKFVYWPPAARLRLASCPGCQRRARADRDLGALGAYCGTRR